MYCVGKLFIKGGGKMTSPITQADLDSQDIPNDNGKIKWYVIGFDDFEYTYLGEHTMTPDNWESVVDALIDEGSKFMGDTLVWKLLRKDQLKEVMWNIACALSDSGDFKKDWLEMDTFDDDLDEPDLSEEVAK
jgi:hypothetical protein